MLSVNGDETCSPFVGLLMVVCASPGTAAAISIEKITEGVATNFIEILQEREYATAGGVPRFSTVCRSLRCVPVASGQQAWLLPADTGLTVTFPKHEERAHFH
jgi:hypothetical protein